MLSQAPRHPEKMVKSFQGLWSLSALTRTPHLGWKHRGSGRDRQSHGSSRSSRRHLREGSAVPTVIVEVPAGLLDGVAVRRRVGRGRGRQVWGDAADGHCLPVSVHRLGVKGAEFGVLGDGRAFEGVSVQIVPGVAGNAWRVGDGADGHLGGRV